MSIGAAVLTEYIYERLMKRPVTVGDGSAVVTGLLLGMNLPPLVPLWMPALGSVFAILVVKQLFGGLGQNFMNPALAGRCFLMISFSARMTSFAVSDGTLNKIVDTVSGATPLAEIKGGGSFDLLSMFLGTTRGTIGETCTLALLAGGIFLVITGVIRLTVSPGLPGELLGVCPFGRRPWNGFSLAGSTALRRRPDAGSMVLWPRITLPGLLHVQDRSSMVSYWVL